jgi:SAM-dependent methyltransferase
MKHNSEPSPTPSPFLIEHVDLYPKGKALDLAMGGGRNAIYLAEQGYEVDGIDISPEFVEIASKRAKQKEVCLNTQVADLEKDYKILENTYDLIICFNYLQRDLISQIKAGLRSGGMIVYETYTVDQVQFGKPKNPDHLLKQNELLDMFRDFRCFYYREGVLEEQRAIARIIAQKMKGKAQGKSNI